MTDYFTVKRNPELIESAVLDKISAEINDEAVKTRNADKRDGLYVAREIVDRYR